MKFLEISQGSDQWFDCRIGKVTGSKFGIFMSNDPGSFGEPAKKYAIQKAIERITGRKIADDYSNQHMERGVLQEPIACRLYEDRYFVDVLPGGFFDCGDFGDSPDGLINDDGVIEIKSVIAPVHYTTLKRGSYDPSYTWQLVGHLDVSGRDWCDFISYCAEFPEGKDLFVYRIYRDEFQDKIDRLRERRAKFINYIKQIQQDIENYEY